MKHFFRTIILGIIAIASYSTANAVTRPTTLYVYGFSASFNDSTVYVTDIMQLDSAWVDSRTNFLYARDSYSSQLKSHLLNKGVVNPTCIISFAKTRKQAEKKYMKLRERYSSKKKTYIIKYVPANEFCFTPISALDDPNVNTDASKAAIKTEKKALKDAHKAEKANKKKVLSTKKNAGKK